MFVYFRKTCHSEQEVCELQQKPLTSFPRGVTISALKISASCSSEKDSCRLDPDFLSFSIDLKSSDPSFASTNVSSSLSKYAKIEILAQNICYTGWLQKTRIFCDFGAIFQVF
jgi:hypothetical protein